MTDWFEAGLPLDQVWYGDPHYWRNTLVDWARKQDPRAFQGKNMLRAYSVRHTQVSVVFDVAMLLVDLPRRTYMFVGFPVGIGGVPGVSVGFDGHMKIWDRDAFERAQSTVARIASEHGLSTPSLSAPDGSTWRAYVKMSRVTQCHPEERREPAHARADKGALGRSSRVCASISRAHQQS